MSNSTLDLWSAVQVQYSPLRDECMVFYKDEDGELHTLMNIHNALEDLQPDEIDGGSFKEAVIELYGEVIEDQIHMILEDY